MPADHKALPSLQGALTSINRSIEIGKVRFSEQSYAHVLRAIERRCIDYSADQLALFGPLLHEGLLERVLPDHVDGPRIEGVFAFLFEKALLTMAMVDMNGNVMLSYRSHLPLSMITLGDLHVLGQGNTS